MADVVGRATLSIVSRQ